MATAAAAVMALTFGAGADKASAQTSPFPVPGGSGTTPNFHVPSIPSTPAITSNGSVVEDVVARINDQVITRTEYERSQLQLVEEAKQEKWSSSELDGKEHDLLRDMIDQQLLLSKGKELGITGDTETIRQLDEIRKRANLPDLESLEKAAAEQGVSYEDFKSNIRNQVITQQVVRDEVGRRIGGSMTPTAEQAYYQAHLKDFEQPEQVHLSEILVATPENASDAQIAAAQAKADGLEAKLKSGTAFAELAKSSSGGPTASAGGDLGDFKRGALGSDVLENATFPLPVGGVTAPIRTRQGFVILKVDSHLAAGTAPLQQVEPQVQEAIYMSQLQPALRSYLTSAREDAYVKVAPGFVDSGSGGADAKTTFTTYAPPPLKKKVVKKQRAEAEKAEKAETQLAAAREKMAEKQQAKAAAAGKRGNAPGTQTVAAVQKPKKIHREKVRYGQAPRNALPNGSTEVVAAVPSLGAAPADGTPGGASGQAPGQALGQSTASAMAPGQALASISTGGNNGAEDSDNPLAQPAGPEHKTRFSARQQETDEKKAQVKVVHAELRTSKRPLAASTEETADEKAQAAPLGFANGAAPAKAAKKHHKRPKDEPKERLQEKVKPVEAPVEVAPTVNPTLGTSATGTRAPATKSADTTTLPPANPTTPGGTPAGQPIPSVTSAQPGQPATTVPPPQ